MALRGFAPKTRSAYLSWVRRLIQFCRVVPDQLTNEHVRAFLLHLTQERKLAFSTFNQALNAARFFSHEVLKRPFVVEGLRYQKPPRRLPVVMNDEEVSRLLAASRREIFASGSSWFVGPRWATLGRNGPQLLQTPPKSSITGPIIQSSQKIAKILH